MSIARTYRQLDVYMFSLKQFNIGTGKVPIISWAVRHCSLSDCKCPGFSSIETVKFLWPTTIKVSINSSVV